MKLGIDMDGVIADFTSSAVRRVKDYWGFDYKYEDLTEPKLGEFVYNRLPRHEKAFFSSPRDVYSYICPPGFFEQLEPYKGTIDTLKLLSEMYEIVIVTKPLEWEHCPEEKVNWLKKYLRYTPNIIMVGSTEMKGLVDVDIMIDDDPRVVKSLTTAIPIMVKRPWNEDFLKFEAIHSVESFNDVLDTIENIRESMYQY